MTTSFKTLGVAAALTLSGAVAAQASLIDFTNVGTYDIISNNTATGTTQGIGWTLVATGGRLNASEAGPGPIGPLAGENDGIGINSDEVTAPNQLLTLTFDSEVTIAGIFALDLFVAPDDSSLERVDVGGDAVAMFEAQVGIDDDPFGFAAFEGLSLTGTTFTFFPESTNDNVGDPDFALAGIDVAPIPLPAGILLLGGALAGLGLARRKA